MSRRRVGISNQTTTIARSSSARRWSNVTFGPVLPPVAGYTAWWDASQITGVADNTKISSWPDSSANAHNLAQATGAKQPTYYKTTSAKLINGLPAVWFDGAATSMASGVLAISQPYTLVFVLKNQNASGNSWALGANAGAIYLADRSSSPGFQAFIVTTVTQGPYDQSLHFVAAVYNGASSSVKVDGNTTTGSLTGTAISSALIIGDETAATFAPWNGPIAEVLLYSSALSAANTASLRTYAQSKWGTP